MYGSGGYQQGGPPHQPYGGAPNPYAPPAAPFHQGFAPPVPEGSFGTGLALGIVFGLWGWLGCLLLAKEETKRGALYGFLGRIAFAFVVVMIAVLVSVVAG